MMGMRSRACVMTCDWRSQEVVASWERVRVEDWWQKQCVVTSETANWLTWLTAGGILAVEMSSSSFLREKITNANGFGEPHILALFHAFPQRLYVNRKKIFFWNWYLAHFFAQPQRPVYQKQIKVFQFKIPTLHHPQIKRFYDDQETVRTFLDFHSIPVAYMASKVGGFCICVCFGRNFTRGFSWWRARQGLSRQRCTRASKWWIARPWIWWALGAGLGQLLR